MDATLKKNIVAALGSYMEVHSLSQAEIEQKSGVNIAYINAMLHGKTTVGKTAIGDSFYKKIADTVGWKYQ